MNIKKIMVFLFIAASRVYAADFVTTSTQYTSEASEHADSLIASNIALNIGIDEAKRMKVAKMLSVLLSNEYVLYTKTLQYHWNVEGKHFDALHKFFGEQYQKLTGFIDAIAERIRALGFLAPGSLSEFIQYGTIPDQVTKAYTELAMIENLLRDHEAIIIGLRKDIDASMALGDAGTNNFLIDLLEKHEKIAWMLRSFLVKA